MENEKSDGSWQEIVLGYDDLDSYRTQDGYLGACLGRVANRIEKGSSHWTIRYILFRSTMVQIVCMAGLMDFLINDSMSSKMKARSLFTTWAKIKKKDFRKFGSLVYVQFKKNTLTIHYEALSDADTLVNLSNHSYFNLDGSDSIQDHRLLVKASKFMEVDADGLVKGVYRDLPADMDFQQEKPIGQALSSSIEQIEVAKGSIILIFSTIPTIRLFWEALFRIWSWRWIRVIL